MARNTATVNVKVVPGKELKVIADKLREIDKKLPNKFRKDLKAAAKPLMMKAKENAKKIPVKKPDKRRLRRKIATGVAIQVSVGKRARIRIVTRMPDTGTAIIPRGLSTDKGFRHPVFGDKTKWVVQRAAGSGNWFMDAMQDGNADAQARIKATLEEAKREIANSGIRH